MEKNPFIHSLEELTQITSELTKRSGQLDKWIKALSQFSLAFQNQQLFDEMLSHLAKMNLGQNKGSEKKGSSAEKKASLSTSKSDNLYDLLNAPGFSEIVKEVMKYKAKKR